MVNLEVAFHELTFQLKPLQRAREIRLWLRILNCPSLCREFEGGGGEDFGVGVDVGIGGGGRHEGHGVERGGGGGAVGGGEVGEGVEVEVGGSGGGAAGARGVCGEGGFG